MALEKIEIENFTAFDHFALTFSPGINVLIGENGTGKTHLMKLGYFGCTKSNQSAHQINKEMKEPSQQTNDLLNLFLPYGLSFQRLIRPPHKHSQIILTPKKGKLGLSYLLQGEDDHTLSYGHFEEHQSLEELVKFVKQTIQIKSIYIPPKDALANAPGFRSLYEKREIHFESIYKDILDSAFLPFLRESNLTKRQKDMLAMLEKHIGGKVTVQGETFFLDNGTGEPLEFDLLAEGLRKLGLLWLLIRNGELDKDTVLFWDEPESNLNPKLMGVIVQVLIELQRMGVQIILATHNFVLLQEFDLRLEKQDKILFHSLYKDEDSNEIQAESEPHFLQLHHNAISKVYTELWDRELQKSFPKETHKDAAE